MVQRDHSWGGDWYQAHLVFRLNNGEGTNTVPECPYLWQNPCCNYLYSISNMLVNFCWGLFIFENLYCTCTAISNTEWIALRSFENRENFLVQCMLINYPSFLEARRIFGYEMFAHFYQGDPQLFFIKRKLRKVIYFIGTFFSVANFFPFKHSWQHCFFSSFYQLQLIHISKCTQGIPLLWNNLVFDQSLYHFHSQYFQHVIEDHYLPPNILKLEKLWLFEIMWLLGGYFSNSVSNSSYNKLALKTPLKKLMIAKQSLLKKAILNAKSSERILKISWILHSGFSSLLLKLSCWWDSIAKVILITLS